MSGLLLTKEEKIRYIQWLKLQIESTEGMIEQMEKVSIPDLIIKKHKLEVVSCKVVLNMLDTEEMSIGG